VNDRDCLLKSYDIVEWYPEEARNPEEARETEEARNPEEVREDREGRVVVVAPPGTIVTHSARRVDGHRILLGKQHFWIMQVWFTRSQLVN